MPPQTESQRKAAYEAAGVPYSPSAPITSQTLAPVPTLDYSTPKQTPVYPVAGLNSDFPDMAETVPEKQANDLTTRLTELNSRLVGESSYRAEQEAEKGLPMLQQTQRDLTSRLTALKNEALAIPLQLQQDATGRGITKSGLAPIETGALRNNAIQALSTSSLLEAANGNVTTALDLVDRAVAQRFDPIREEIDTATKNLDLILKSPAYSAAEKKRALKEKIWQEDRLRRIEKEEADQTQILTIATQAAKNRADAVTLRNIQAAKTPQEALAAAGNFLSENKTQVVKLDNGSTVVIDERTGKVVNTLGGAKPVEGGGLPLTISGADGKPAQYGTTDYFTSLFQSTSGSKKYPVAQEREDLSKFSNVIAQTDNLVASMKNLDTDPVIGALKSLNPYDFDARTVNAQLQALVPGVARGVYGEVGVLTDADIKNYLRTLPNIKSTKQQNQFVAALTLKNAARSFETRLATMAQSGINVSGFVPQYTSMLAQIDRIERDLGISDTPEVQIAPYDKKELENFEFSGSTNALPTQGITSKVRSWFSGLFD